MLSGRTTGNIMSSKISDKRDSQLKCFLQERERERLLRVFIHLFIMLQFPKKENTSPVRGKLLQWIDCISII